jgi:hypothetical protein
MCVMPAAWLWRPSAESRLMYGIPVSGIRVNDSAHHSPQRLMSANPDTGRASETVLRPGTH